jgi:retinol dehydrogenase 12
MKVEPQGSAFPFLLVPEWCCAATDLACTTLVVDTSLNWPNQRRMTARNWSERIAVVTGATQGIGLVAAREIAKKGARTILIARDADRGNAAMAQVKAAAGHDRVEVAHCDFASQASIRALAADLQQRVTHLDLLVNNAGAVFNERSVTEDGIERTFAVNHLGYFLLTNLLLDVIRKAGRGARIVSVASDAHRIGKIDFDDINATRSYSGFRVYGASKLANILFTRELARRVAGDGISANCLHPGVVATGFAKNENGIVARLAKLIAPLLASPDSGARTTVYLATSDAVEGVTGKYFAKCRQVNPSRRAQDDDVARQLWDLSTQMTHLAP